MKHCLTNSKHQHIGAKRSVLWPSKYAPVRARGARDAYPTPPGARFSHLRQLPLGSLIWGFSVEPRGPEQDICDL